MRTPGLAYRDSEQRLSATTPHDEQHGDAMSKSPLHEAAKAKGYTVRQLTKLIGCNYGHLDRVFNGKQHPGSKTFAAVTFNHWGKLAELLGLDPKKARSHHLSYYNIKDNLNELELRGKLFASKSPHSPMFLLRSLRKLTQRDLVKKTELGLATISYLENCEKSNEEYLTRVAKVLDVDPYRFIAGMRRFARDRELQSHLTAMGTIAGNDPMFNLLRTKCVELGEMPVHHPKRQYLMETIQEISEAWELRQEERKEQMYEEIKKVSGQ
jgi:transcriptional regulator with XRE-family HTH domain